MPFYTLFRMSLKPTPSNLAGTLSVVTTITMATALLRLPTPNSPTDGTFPTTTTQRYACVHAWIIIL